MNSDDDRQQDLQADEERSIESSSLGDLTQAFLVDDDIESLPLDDGSLGPNSGGHVPKSH